VGKEIVVVQTELRGFNLSTFNKNAQEAFAEAVAQKLGSQITKEHIALQNIRMKTSRRLLSTRRLNVVTTLAFDTWILSANNAQANAIQEKVQEAKFKTDLLNTYRTELQNRAITVPQNMALDVSNAYTTRVPSILEPENTKESRSTAAYVGGGFIGALLLAFAYEQNK